MADEEIKALLLRFFKAAGMHVNEIELQKNAFHELVGIHLIRPNDKRSQEEIRGRSLHDVSILPRSLEGGKTSADDLCCTDFHQLQGFKDLSITDLN